MEELREQLEAKQQELDDLQVEPSIATGSDSIPTLLVVLSFL
jgi:hypothetical protein